MSNVGKRGKLKLESRLRAALLNGTNTRLENHEIKRVIDALLKPPAREDAQPVAWRVGDDGAVYTTLKAAKAHVDGWRRQGMTCCDPQPLYTHPAPDALRVAVEALEFYRDAWNSEPNGDPRIEGDASGSLTEPADALLDDKGTRASQALAALQAEQGAK